MPPSSWYSQWGLHRHIGSRFSSVHLRLRTARHRSHSNTGQRVPWWTLGLSAVCMALVLCFSGSLGLWDRRSSKSLEDRRTFLFLRCLNQTPQTLLPSPSASGPASQHPCLSPPCSLLPTACCGGAPVRGHPAPGGGLDHQEALSLIPLSEPTTQEEIADHV